METIRKKGGKEGNRKLEGKLGNEGKFHIKTSIGLLII
jgi:hypothetical protein